MHTEPQNLRKNTTTVRWSPLGFLLMATIVILNVALCCAQTTYTWTDLGTLCSSSGVCGDSSSGAGINSSGQVTGWSDMPSGNSVHAFVYTSGLGMMDLGTLGGDFSQGNAINDSGQVTGWSSNTPGSCVSCTEHVFLYNPPGGTATPAGMNDLNQQVCAGGVCPNGAAGTLVAGHGINNTGVITGTINNESSSPNAFVFPPEGAMANADFNQPGWTGSQGIAINNSGQITGWFNQNLSADAFILTNSAMPKSLGAFPSAANTVSPGSQGASINNLAQVTGAAGPNKFASVDVFLFTNATGSMIDLGVPTGGIEGIGNSINDHGQIVGEYFNENQNQSALLFSPGPPSTMVDLNTRIDPSTPLPANVTLTAGNAINNSGWIVADGTNSATGVSHAYLLQPVYPSKPPCVLAGKFLSCSLRPMMCGTNGFNFCAKACAFPGCASTVVIWPVPVLNGGDPWLNGLQASLVVPTLKEARSISTGLQISASTKPETQTVAERTTSAELIERGALTPVDVSVVGPLVEIAAAPAAAPEVRSFTNHATEREKERSIELSLPFAGSEATLEANIRLVKFDGAKGQWVDIEDQYVTLTKHLVTARVSSLGRFTVVAEKQKARPGVLPRPQLGAKAGLSR
jgi:probable HAF family extracellular repeat protein